MKIGFKSDIHLDFWLPLYGSIDSFIKEILKPQEADVLIIAGDLGHYNDQNILLLKKLKNFFKNILVTFGNHDFYLLDKKFNTYKERIEDLKNNINSIEGIYFLDGDFLEIEGVGFAGAGGWYDFSLAVKHGYPLEKVKLFWHYFMNDAKNIKPEIDPVNFSMLQKEKLRKSIDKADIVFTHVPPLYINCYGKPVLDSFYSFYGYDLFKDNIKYWIFGHCHKPMDFYEEHIRFLSSPLGYPHIRTGKFEIDYLNKTSKNKTSKEFSL
ncbi:metallophosphoesterase family protein [Caminibacter sp.]